MALFHYNSLFNSSMKQPIQIESSFISALTRVENNLINSFKLLQDNLNTTIQQIHLKTSMMEDKILQIFHAKEKVILKLNSSIESLKINLSSVEESLVNLASSKAGDSYSVIETHVNLKIEKFIRQEREKMGELQTEMMDLETKLEQKIDKNFNQRMRKNDLEAMRNRINVLETKIEEGSSKPISNYNSNEDVSSIRQQLKEINKLVSKIVEDSNRHEKKIKQIEESSYRSTPHNTIERKNEHKPDPFPSTKYQTDHNQRPKLNFNDFQKQTMPEVMEVGLKGLRKSKQKREINERQQSNILLPRSNLLQPPLSSLPKKKDLPPLSKQMPMKTKRKEIQLPSKQEIEDELGEIFVNDDGYLMDKDGNYLRDEMGNLIDAEGLQLQDEEQQDYDQY